MSKLPGVSGGEEGGTGSANNNSQVGEVKLGKAKVPPGEVPWSVCIFGCGLMPGRKVALLPCSHVVCSRMCATRVVSRAQAGTGLGSANPPLKCEECLFPVSRELLSNFETWVDPGKLFPGKGPTPVDKSLLICGFCTRGYQATVYCKGCAALLCDECERLHPQLVTTRDHVLQPDLEEAMRPLITGECGDHRGKMLTHLCLACLRRLCGECLGIHEGSHKDKVVVMEGEKQKLVEKMYLARKVMNSSTEAIAKLSQRRLEIVPQEFEAANVELRKQFCLLIDILSNRWNEVTAEARQLYNTQLVTLEKREKAAEVAKSAAQHFLKTAEIMMSKRSDLDTVNFLSHSEPCLQFLSEMEQKVSAGFNGFVDHDFHLLVNSSEDLELQQYVEKFSHVEYKKVTGTGTLPPSLGQPQQGSPNASGYDADSSGSSRSQDETVTTADRTSAAVETVTGGLGRILLEETISSCDAGQDTVVISDLSGPPSSATSVVGQEKEEDPDFEIVYEHIVPRTTPGLGTSASSGSGSSVEELPTSSGQTAARTRTADMKMEEKGLSTSTPVKKVPSGEKAKANPLKLNFGEPKAGTSLRANVLTMTPAPEPQAPTENPLIPIRPQREISSSAAAVPPRSPSGKPKRKHSRLAPKLREEENEQEGSPRSELDTKNEMMDSHHESESEVDEVELGTCYETDYDTNGSPRRRSYRLKYRSQAGSDLVKEEEMFMQEVALGAEMDDDDDDEDEDFPPIRVRRRRIGRKRKVCVGYVNDGVDGDE